MACSASSTSAESGDGGGDAPTNVNEGMGGGGAASDRDEIGTLKIPEGSGGRGVLDPGPSEEVPRYLLHITSDNTLVHLSIDDGSASEVCDLNFLDEAPWTGFCSLTFNREDRLFASTWGGRSGLWEIELPSCDTKFINAYGHGGVCGISPAPAGNSLIGASVDSDVLLDIDENTGDAAIVGPLGQNFGPVGTTWVEADNTIRAIDGTTDGLFTLEATTGTASFNFDLDHNFGSVGMEYHPQTNKIYGCTNSSSNLLEISLEDGTSSSIGDTGLSGCDNLGAPFAEPQLPPLVPFPR